MRSAFRMSDINRIVSACRQRKKEKERIALINAQGGNCKELKPTYTLQNVIFNDVTRMAKIEFIEEQTYRTVVRYVTQNYVKYPIYSSWKTKTKTITKNIKLTNAELERLNCNNDFFIREFAKDIIVALNNKELLPSWFLIECLKSEFQEKIDNIETQFFAYNSSACALASLTTKRTSKTVSWSAATANAKTEKSSTKKFPCQKKRGNT